MSDSQSLYLLRHAMAEPWSPGLSDMDRRLDPRGASHVARLADWAKQNLVPPDAVLCSPAMRTKQTLEGLEGHWIGPATTVRIEPDIYEATTGRLQSLAEAAFSSCRTLMIIGHNPGLEYLAQLVAGNSAPKNTARMAMGTLVVVRFPSGWQVGGETAELRHWLASETLE